MILHLTHGTLKDTKRKENRLCIKYGLKSKKKEVWKAVDDGEGDTGGHARYLLGPIRRTHSH